MFSLKTLQELSEAIESFTHSEIDRIIAIFEFNIKELSENPTKVTKSTGIFKELKSVDRRGPYGGDLKMELLEYVIERYFKTESIDWKGGDTAYGGDFGTVKYDNAFSYSFQELSNSLKRDGYIIEGETVKKQLPQEINEAKIESELESLLEDFDFTQSKGHLKQAVENHISGNWAGANSQFRTFIESLLIEISKRLLPGNEPKSAKSAISLLSSSANPPFLLENLNEVSQNDKKASYLEGFWARLNPQGSHPGLSDEEDCTFRYHTTMVVARLLLSRLTKYA